VLDNTSGPEKGITTTTWTSAPDVTWEEGKTAGAFRLASPASPFFLEMFFLGSQNTTQTRYRGSSRPFAGWQIEQHLPAPASALVVEQPARNSWAATLWTLGNRDGANRDSAKRDSSGKLDGAPPQMKQWKDSTSWEMQLPGNDGTLTLRREGNTLRLHTGRGADEILELAAQPDAGPAHAALDRQFKAVALLYPPSSSNPGRLKKVTYLLFGVFLLQWIFFAVYRRMRGPFLNPLKYLTVITWIAGGIWLAVFFV
jgi:hypothetical protein